MPTPCLFSRSSSWYICSKARAILCSLSLRTLLRNTMMTMKEMKKTKPRVTAMKDDTVIWSQAYVLSSPTGKAVDVGLARTETCSKMRIKEALSLGIFFILDFYWHIQTNIFFHAEHLKKVHNPYQHK